MAAVPTLPKGPKLTLSVSSAHLARLEASKPSLLDQKSSIQTPSSTVVEFGDGLDIELSAAERADHIFRILMSQSQTPAVEDVEVATPISDTTQSTGMTHGANSKLINETLGRFLQTLGHATGDPNKELVQENKGLHKQIVAMQRKEEHLLRDKQDLNSHLASIQEDHAAQQRQLEDRFQQEKAALEARIKQLEEQAAQQNERVSRLTANEPAKMAEAMTDADVATWFTTRTASWSAWADEFAHHSPNRMAELHPVQQKEVYDSVQDFIRLDENGALPGILASMSEGSSVNVTRLLLLGMLNDFVVAETLASPFWVFEALSKQSFDLDSPVLSQQESVSSSTGFRIELATWNNTGLAPCPSPFVVPPAPTTARSISMLSPGRAPPAISPMQPLTLNTKGFSVQYGLPAKTEMEDLFTLLSRTQRTEEEVTAWRAKLLQMLAEGGLDRDASHPSMVNNEDKQMLANARREYARRLRERFLSSAARFFLRDQDAQGIAKLEGRLVSELDLALRFSIQVWSRASPLAFLRLKEIATPARGFKFNGSVAELYRAGQPTDSDTPLEDQQVAVVVRPALGNLKKIGGSGQVWVKAQVLVVPKPTPADTANPKVIKVDTSTPRSKTMTIAIPPNGASEFIKSR